MKTATLNMRVDPSVKEEAERVYAQFGMNLTDAVTCFCTNRSWKVVCPSNCAPLVSMLKLKLLCVKLVKLLPDVSLLVAICRHRRRSLMSMMSDSQQGRRSLVMTSQFKKDLKRARKRGLPNRLANRGN